VAVNSIILPDGVEEEDDVAYDISSKNNWEDDKNKTIIGAAGISSENVKIGKKDDLELDFDDI